MKPDMIRLDLGLSRAFHQFDSGQWIFVAGG
jgi:hypothetical protein